MLTDLCRLLDIANPRNVTARLDSGDVESVRQADGNRGNPNVTVVHEAGMYEVVIRSYKPEAAAFRRWITGAAFVPIQTYAAQRHLRWSGHMSDLCCSPWQFAIGWVSFDA